MKIIPASNVLVVLIGPSGAGKSTWANANFDPDEIISSDALRVELTGQMERQDKNDLVFQEFFHRIEKRLRAGLRAVADATHLAAKDRKTTARVARELGLPVYYVVINRSLISKMKTAGWRDKVRIEGKSLVETHDEKFQATLPAIKTGDDSTATLVLFPLDEEVQVVGAHMGWESEAVIATPGDPLPEFRLIRDLKEASVLHRIRDPKGLTKWLAENGFTRVRVIGDVHGNMDGLLKAILEAPGGTFFLFLGDIPDYGVYTLETVTEVYRLIREGKAWSIRGNHEKKVLNYVLQERGNGFRGQQTHGNSITFNRLKAMEPEARRAWENEMQGLVEMSPDWVQIGPYLFVHAAGHPGMWNNPLFRAHRGSALESYALYGETDGTKGPDGFPTRLYNWVKDIPQGHTVVVGHAIRQVEEPLIETNEQGGRVVFLDTGSSKELDGKPGKLSWLDLEIMADAPSQLSWVGVGSELS